DAPAGLSGHLRRASSSRVPVRDFALGILDVEVNTHMRIDEGELRYGSNHGHQSVLIDQRVRMVRGQRTRNKQAGQDCNQTECFGFHVPSGFEDANWLVFTTHSEWKAIYCARLCSTQREKNTKGTNQKTKSTAMQIDIGR